MPITPEQLAHLVDEAFKPSGPFSKIFPLYKYRADQVLMAQVIAKGLATGKAAFAEAGTGTGKSFGSLIPAALYAAIEGKRVLVVTHNIALQQQLYDGDIPIVKKVLDIMGLEFRPALLKGKNNFVCTKALQETIKRNDPEDREELQKFLKDARKDGKIVIGDKDKLSYQPSDEFWAKISVTPETDCSDCPFKENACFPRHNRKLAEEANLVISNQFMLMNDLVARRKNGYAPNSGTLPDYDVLIVDVAHHLEEVASDFLGYKIEWQPIRKLIGRMRKVFSSNGPLKDYYPERRHKVMKLINEMETFYLEMLKDVRQYLEDKKVFAEFLEKPLKGDIEVIQKLSFEILFNKTRIKDNKIVNILEGFVTSLSDLYETAQIIQEGIKTDNREFVFWCEKHGEDSAIVKATPVAVNKYLREGLFDRMPVILTSATMKFDSDLSFFARKVGCLEEGEYESVFINAPFDYENKVCFYVPHNALDAPKSGDVEGAKAYDEYCMNEMYELVKMSRGRAFLLFTSNSAVKQYYDALAPKFEAMGYKCFRQGGGIDRNQMIKEFKEHGNAVLFGADTFWEGISVPGRELSLVVIHKLPFATPNPVSKAREVNIEENGGDRFLEGQVFPAIIKYKQGFGRLIRHENDKGVFCVLDGRIFSKKDRYGKYFLRATPKTQYAVYREDLKPFFD
jgi:ATP-dependent DNA helicase DinG